MRPAVAAQWQTTRNGEARPPDVMPGSSTKVWWKCPASSDHGWAASPTTRTRAKNPSRWRELLTTAQRRSLAAPVRRTRGREPHAVQGRPDTPCLGVQRLEAGAGVSCGTDLDVRHGVSHRDDIDVTRALRCPVGERVLPAVVP
ncbi:zinc-ribbon domain-containing protein [Streptomyces sp. NPDC059371]|uniref:zinc-ribbon domain-containing protein n=1 Tax=Streptomyces sp. NPDC059371 TaxID=3346812 RepID=UPI0036B24D1E